MIKKEKLRNSESTGVKKLKTIGRLGEGDTAEFTIAGGHYIAEEIEFDGFEVEVDKEKSNETDDRMDSIAYGRKTMETAEFNAEDIVDELEPSENGYMTNKHSDLVSISGVGNKQAERLVDAGFEDKEDVKKTSQSELSDVYGIGNALAARIKADVGEVVDSRPSFLDEDTLMVNMHD